MACPIKDANGELDTEALKDLTTLGGHILEGGIRKYADWREAMKAKVGDVFNEGDLQTIWANTRAEAARRTGVPQSPRDAQSVFVDKLAKRVGIKPAAKIVNDLVGPNGDTSLIDKLVQGNALTAAEAKAVATAYQAHAPARTVGKPSGGMAVLQSAIDAAKAEAKAATGRGARTAGQSAPRGAADLLKARLGAGYAPFEKAVGAPLVQKWASGAKLTQAEGQKLVQSYLQHHPPGVKPPAPPAAIKALDEMLGHARRAQAAAAKPPPTLIDTAMGYLATALGGKDQAAKFRAAIKAPDGTEGILNKLASNPSSLTLQERQQVWKAYQAHRKAAAPPAPPSAIASELGAIRKQNTPGKSLTDRLKDRLGTGYTAFEKQVGAPLVQKWAAGTLTPQEERTFAQAYVQHRVPGTPPPAAPPQFQSLDQMAAEIKRAQINAAKPPPTVQDVVAKHLGNAVGGDGVNRAAFRAALKDANGQETILSKLATGGKEAMTDAERTQLQNAFTAHYRARTAPVQTDLSKLVSGAAKEARETMARERHAAMLGQWQTRKDYIREQVTPTLDAKRLPRFTADMAKVRDGDNKALAEVYNRYAPQSVGKKIEGAMRAGLLSGPATVGTIALSHLAALGMEDLPVRAVAHVVSGGTVAPPSFVQTGRAVGAALTRGGKEAGTILRSGENALTISGTNRLHKPEQPLRPEYTVGHGGVPAAMWNGLVRAPMRAHSAMYHVLGTGAYERGLAESAYVKAAAEAKAAKAAGKAWTGAQRAARVLHLTANPTPDMIAHARAYQQQQMFANPNFVSDKINEFQKSVTAKHGRVAGNLIQGAVGMNAPFVKVPSNIAGRALEYSPAGIIKGLGLLDKNLTTEQRANLAMAMGRGVVGTGLIGAGYAAGQHGVVNAPDPQHGEYGSVNIGKYKTDLSRLQPIAAPVLAGAEAAKLRQDAEDGVPISPVGPLATMLTESPMSRIGEVAEAMTSPDSRALNRTLGGYAGMFVPTIASQTAAQFDPAHALRQKDGVLDYVKNKVPGLRETLPVKTDRNGRPIPESGGLLPIPRTAVRLPKTGLDEAYDMMDTLQAQLQQPIRTPEDYVRHQAMRRELSALQRAVGPIGRARTLQRINQAH